MKISLRLVIFILSFNAVYLEAASSKLKNIANIKGVRENVLHGFGIVFGLARTGDSAAFNLSKASAANMLKHLGIKAEPNDLIPGNYASVVITATLPPFARIGDQIDVRISANGDAISLAGGTLIQTPLKGPDNQVYALAQGAIAVGQASGKGTGVLTVAHLPRAASVEREFIPDFVQDGVISLSLKRADFTNNARVVKAINTFFHGFYARSLDPVLIEVEVPKQYEGHEINFIAEMESLEIDVDSKAVVVVNERTGTVVMGADVRVLPISVAHGQLSISVAEGEGQNSDKKSGGAILEIKATSVKDVVNSLNMLGAKPEDLVGILQAIFAAGALQGELQFI